MPGGDWPALIDAEEKTLSERYAEEIAGNFDPESQVRAMDKEGLDLAILYLTSAMYVTAFHTARCKTTRRLTRRLDFTRGVWDLRPTRGRCRTGRFSGPLILSFVRTPDMEGEPRLLPPTLARPLDILM